MNKYNLYVREHELLREELNNLKNCQVTYFTASVTATTLIFTVAARISPPEFPGAAYLFPLAILIPTWFIFFDKATGITRIVGYYRILEEWLQGEGKDYKFIGWENSLKLFRKCSSEYEKKPQI